MNTQDPRYRPFSLVQWRSRNSLRCFSRGWACRSLPMLRSKSPLPSLLWDWSLKREAGISVGIDLDKTRNTRKVGNIVS